MKKLLFIIPTLRTGGAEKSLVSLLKGLDYSKYDVSLYAFETSGELRKDIPETVHIRESGKQTRALNLEMRLYFHDLLSEKHYRSALIRIKASVLHAVSRRFHTRPISYWYIVHNYVEKIEDEYDAVIGYLEGQADLFALEKVNAAKRIAWIHTDVSLKTYNWREIAAYNRFDKIVTISEKCKESLITCFKIPEKKVVVIQNPIDDRDIIEKAKLFCPNNWSKDHYHIVTVGRLEYIKGIDLAIEACRILIDDHVPVIWHVYGTGSQKEELQRRIEIINLTDAFILEGMVSNPYPYIKNADIVVQPSRGEGKSIVLDEAKILGKAIVCTDYPSVDDQVMKDKNGIVTPISPEGIATGVRLLLNDCEKKKKIEEYNYQTENEPIEEYMRPIIQLFE